MTTLKEIEARWASSPDAIAHAPTDIAWLLAEVERLKGVCGGAAGKLNSLNEPTGLSSAQAVGSHYRAHIASTAERLEAAVKGEVENG